MTRLDPSIRAKRILEFATNLVPALMNSAMIAMQMGVPFNVQRAITKLADQLDISEHVQDWFEDPEFEEKMAAYSALGPKDSGKASMNTNEGVMQNKGFPEKRNIMDPSQQFNRDAQRGSSEAQSTNYGNLGL